MARTFSPKNSCGIKTPEINEVPSDKTVPSPFMTNLSFVKLLIKNVRQRIAVENTIMFITYFRKSTSPMYFPFKTIAPHIKTAVIKLAMVNCPR